MSRGENPTGDRRIAWQNVLTVVSAAILIGAEVFGAAFAGGWAVASYLDLGPYGVHIMQGIFFALRHRRHGRASSATPDASSRSPPAADDALADALAHPDDRRSASEGLARKKFLSSA